MTALFGKGLSGTLDHAIEIVAIVAFVAVVATTLGIIVAHAITTGASTLPALSGAGKGIKWLQTIDIALSIVLRRFFIVPGATRSGASAFVSGIRAAAGVTTIHDQAPSPLPAEWPEPAGASRPMRGKSLAPVFLPGRNAVDQTSPSGIPDLLP